MNLSWDVDRFASLPRSLVVWLSGDARIRGDLERLGERVGSERAGREIVSRRRVGSRNRTWRDFLGILRAGVHLLACGMRLASAAENQARIKCSEIPSTLQYC